MGANESQLKDPHRPKEEFVTATASGADETNNQSRELKLASSPMQSPIPHSEQPVHPPHIHTHMSTIIMQSNSNEHQLEQNLAQAQGELNEIRRKTLERKRINALRKEKEMLRAAAGKPKSKTRVRKTEPMTKASDSHQELAETTATMQMSASAPPSSLLQSHESTDSSTTSSSTISLPPSAPVVNATPSEATLAYLVHSLQSNSQHQHIDVLTRQIELLKEKMDDFRREKEKEAKKAEKKREEEQRKEWLRTVNDIDPNTSSASASAPSSFSDTMMKSDMTDQNDLPHTKKARRSECPTSEAIPATPSFHADPVFQQQIPPDYSHSQFQQLRDTIARDEVSSYPNDDEMQYPSFMHQQYDQDDQQQEPTNYDAIYAKMNEFIQHQQDTNHDVDMVCEPTSDDTQISITTTPTVALPPSRIAVDVQSTVFSPGSSPISTSPSTSLLTRAEASRNILDLCLTGDSFVGLEQQFLSGKVSIDQVKYELMVLHNILLPQHEKELMQNFERLRIEQKDASESSTSTTLVRASDSIIHRTLLSLPPYNNSFTPDLAVDDDPDGCARIRIHEFVQNEEQQQSNQPQGQLKRKKHQRSSDDDQLRGESSASSSTSLQVSASSSASSSPNFSDRLVPSVATSSTSSYSSSSPIPSSSVQSNDYHICRMNYINHAFERLFGFTQSDIKGSNFYDLTLRKDHHHATLRIHSKWWTGKLTDAILYEVRARKDGTFVYCLVHWRISFLKGRLRQAVVSFMPLPDDPEHPMPPYVEGVNLDIDTLLYGYKPPMTAAKNG